MLELFGASELHGGTFAFELTARVAFIVLSTLQHLSLKAPCY